MDTSYQPVFVIGAATFPWAVFLVPLLVAIAGLLVMRSGKSGGLQSAAAIVAGVCAAALLIFCVTILPESIREIRTFPRGSWMRVQGRIKSIQSTGDKPGSVSVTINETTVTYSPGIWSPCFHNAGGLLREGLNVRIFYGEDCIYRVDLGRQ